MDNESPPEENVQTMSAVVNTMDMEQIEYRAVIKFLTKQGKPPQTILNEMKAVYGPHCPGKTMIYKWYGLFQKGRKMIEDRPRALSVKHKLREPRPVTRRKPAPKKAKPTPVRTPEPVLADLSESQLAPIADPALDDITEPVLDHIPEPATLELTLEHLTEPITEDISEPLLDSTHPLHSIFDESIPEPILQTIFDYE